ncbi:hypothetical protein GH714_024368 [Hevea brasiliensis]|uniref:Fe2OG dioxygenase domain-containing protein n=1 Tax=Hevea brasiliensis TaxID=3981 RepID=A0A6A6MNX6_HEVBR|nr:hypothetical protein GH714_024368 [Hevea brasiliensis]
MSIDPPFQETCNALFKGPFVRAEDEKFVVVEECELPLIDMKCLTLGQKEREKCIKKMAEAASEWGFFQVVNHGISQELSLGNPDATCLRQFSWSEALHISLADISRMDGYKTTLRSTIEAFAGTAATLAQSLAETLAQNLGVKSNYFGEYCTPNTSYLRMNRYPPCPFFSDQVCGLMPHTDSDFLTIIYQDQTGGLQLKKQGRWLTVRPNPQSVIINIGDLFQVLSNNVFRSMEHRVLAPKQVERFSVAYFYCPSYDAVIQCYGKPAMYRKFSFREYKQQIQKDVQATGDKVGVSRFLL